MILSGPTIDSSSSSADSSSPRFYKVLTISKSYHKMLVSRNERNVSELVFNINAQCFDTVSERVSGGDTWNVGQEALENSFVHRLVDVVFLI